MGNLLCNLVQIYSLCVLVRVLLSWFPPPAPGSAFETFAGFLSALTDPVLDPLRRALPPARMGGMALDLSPMVLLLLLQIVVGPLLCSL